MLLHYFTVSFGSVLVPYSTSLPLPYWPVSIPVPKHSVTRTVQGVISVTQKTKSLLLPPSAAIIFSWRNLEFSSQSSRQVPKQSHCHPSSWLRILRKVIGACVRRRARERFMAQPGIFEACLTISDQGDTTGLLQCISDKLEGSHSVTSKTLNSYLLVISVSSSILWVSVCFSRRCKTELS